MSLLSQGLPLIPEDPNALFGSESETRSLCHSHNSNSRHLTLLHKSHGSLSQYHVILLAFTMHIFPTPDHFDFN